MVYGAPGSNLANRSVLNLSFLDSGDKVLHQGIQTYGWINLNFIGFVMFFKNIRCKSLPLLFFNIWFPLQIVLKSINFVEVNRRLEANKEKHTWGKSHLRNAWIKKPRPFNRYKKCNFPFL